MSAAIVPYSGTTTGWSSATANEGTLRTRTQRTRPSSTRAVASTRPTAVSMRTTVSGSVAGRLPVSSRAVTAHIVLLPDMGRKPPCSRTMMPTSAPGSSGGSTRTAHIAGCPRGSRSSNRRSQSSSVAHQRIRSGHVAPRTSRWAPSRIRPGSPSACTSIDVIVVVPVEVGAPMSGLPVQGIGSAPRPDRGLTNRVTALTLSSYPQIVKQSAGRQPDRPASPGSRERPLHTERHIVTTTDLTGILVALVTPFTADGSEIDATALDAHVDRLIEEGAHGLVPGGSTGEFTTLSLDERKQLTELVVKAAGGRVPVGAGTGALSTRDAGDLAAHAAQAGAPALMVVAPV